MTQNLNSMQVADAANWFAKALDYPGVEEFEAQDHDCVKRWLSDPAQLIEHRDKVEYTGLFDIGTPEPPVPLTESFYHPDGQARLQRVVSFYRTYGVINKSSFAPDHLCIELAYLAYLAQLAEQFPDRSDLVDAYRAYTQAHPACWISKCLHTLKKANKESVFVQLLAALECFLLEVAENQMIPAVNLTS